MNTTCRIELDGTSHEFPVVRGTEDERAIDISTLRDRTGYITPVSYTHLTLPTSDLV